MFSLTFHIYDLIALLYYKIYDKKLVLHHCMVLLSYVTAFLFRHGATECVGKQNFIKTNSLNKCYFNLLIILYFVYTYFNCKNKIKNIIWIDLIILKIFYISWVILSRYF